MIQFDRVTCISLATRDARWNEFLRNLPKDWPFKQPEHITAVMGRRCRPPSWWKQGPGAWGCYRSHLRLIEECINDGTNSILLMEDDAICCPKFAERCTAFLEHVPRDWQMIYLGGQHLFMKGHPPREINDHVVQPYNVNRTHAFAISGSMLRVVYHHLNNTTDWKRGHHIDHRLGLLHMTGKYKVYAPRDWLIGQIEAQSDIKGKRMPTRFWSANPQPGSFVVVLGLHRSGSSCIAGVIAKLGVHMGNKFGGCEADGGHEAVALMRMCEKAMPYPGIERHAEFKVPFTKWMREKVKEAENLETIAGAKYPHLCEFADEVHASVGAGLRVIHINRPLEQSIASLIRRDGRRIDHTRIDAVQRRLWEKKHEFLEKKECPVLHVEYADLLSDPTTQVRRIIDFLGLHPTDAQISQAVQYVKPEKRHIS